jgi:hypothetical protein
VLFIVLLTRSWALAATGHDDHTHEDNEQESEHAGVSLGFAVLQLEDAVNGRSINQY